LTLLPGIEDITASIVERARRSEALPPSALTLLVRQYRASGRADVAGVLGDALARALAQPIEAASRVERASWVSAFAEAMTVSEDARLGEAARGAIAALAAEWPSLVEVDEATASIDACLSASHLVDPQELVPRAIDQLERIVGAAYRPGDGIAHTAGCREHRRGGLVDHVRAAAALLTAFELTARLPYSMLAEELMQTSRDWLAPPTEFISSCEAARVLCRLARLHDNTEYRSAAVIAADADYRADAARVLERLAVRLGDPDADAALYALVIEECSPRSS
jgi:hypothetical protein